jgi:hypothetical protein
MRIVALLILPLLLPVDAWPGEPGTAGADFLNIAAGPRGAAMGGAQTAAAQDAYAAYWNPAALSLLRRPEASLVHNKLYEGISLQHMALALPGGPRWTVGFHATRLAVEAFDGYDATGAREGSVDASDTALGGSAGVLLLSGGRRPDIRAGFGGRWINERLASASASTFAADAGLLLSRWDRIFGRRGRGLSIGLAARHLGSGLTFHKDEAPLPRTVSAGVALTRPLGADRFTLAADLHAPQDDGLTPAFGAEYVVRGLLAARAGYSGGSAAGPGLRLGVGLALGRVAFDYSFAAYGDLGSAHRFGMSLRFGASTGALSRDERLGRARELVRQGRPFEAAAEAETLLDEDPGDREALGILAEAVEPGRKGKGGKHRRTREE